MLYPNHIYIYTHTYIHIYIYISGEPCLVQRTASASAACWLAPHSPGGWWCSTPTIYIYICTHTYIHIYIYIGSTLSRAEDCSRISGVLTRAALPRRLVILYPNLRSQRSFELYIYIYIYIYIYTSCRGLLTHQRLTRSSLSGGWWCSTPTCARSAPSRRPTWSAAATRPRVNPIISLTLYSHLLLLWALTAPRGLVMLYPDLRSQRSFSTTYMERGGHSGWNNIL